ncbi:MAG: RyR domain-containing protein [Eubacteriaceae bacterium]
MKNMTIVVTGDVCINTLQWIKQPPNSQGLNWQKHSNVNNNTKGGESLLLSDMVRLSTNAKVLSPNITGNKCDLIRSTVELDLFPKYNENCSDKVYRISRFLGFTGPPSSLTKLLPVVDDNVNADMVIIDDENNGFNMSEKYWPLALKQKDHYPVVLYKLNKPSNTNDLWFHLEQNHIEKTVVIINSEDLRSQGVNISKSLSWERTAEDFVWQLNNNPNLSILAKCKHLVVPFGLEGCIYYRNNDNPKSTLYFVPYEIEGGFAKKIQGNMYGLTSCLVAALARSIVVEPASADNLSPLISEGIKEGIVAAQNYFIEGFGKKLDQLKFPVKSIFHESYKEIIIKEHVQEVMIPNSSIKDIDNLWYILNDKSSTNLAEMAYNIVKNGEEKTLRYIPIASFGSLKTVDRIEIENYRSVKKLMSEYISTENTVRPLSIAVFGTPGSGKSYGVTEVATSIAPKKIVKLTFNLSQFNNSDDLIRAFHKARDYSLQGKLPLLIFDEFDSEYQGKLGWLKYFLAPMQDGVFREGDSEHPIGKAIFVFAGGTSSTFNEFNGETIDSIEEKNKFNKDFKNSKGLDFISRLRGYVNILGPNPISDNDQLYVIRRAMMLRSLIKRKTPHLFNSNEETQIDDGVLRAMLKVPKFKHETRSMEAILDMSMLNKVNKWEQSHLPLKEQLKLHVDEEEFMKHLMHNAFFSENLEQLASYLFNEYNAIEGNHLNWNTANKESKNFYLELARSIPDALLCINYDIVSVNLKPAAVIFTDKELETLAKYEHTRWLLHKKNRGWKFDEVFDKKERTDPHIVSYNLLPNHKKEQILKFVNSWSEALSNVHYALMR